MRRCVGLGCGGGGDHRPAWHWDSRGALGAPSHRGQWTGSPGLAGGAWCSPGAWSRCGLGAGAVAAGPPGGLGAEGARERQAPQQGLRGLRPGCRAVGSGASFRLTETHGDQGGQLCRCRGRAAPGASATASRLSALRAEPMQATAGQAEERRLARQRRGGRPLPSGRSQGAPRRARRGPGQRGSRRASRRRCRKAGEARPRLVARAPPPRLSPVGPQSAVGTKATVEARSWGDLYRVAAVGGVPCAASWRWVRRGLCPPPQASGHRPPVDRD